MDRRSFISTVALAGLAGPSKAAVEVEVVRPRSPFEALLRDIEPGHDEFPLEKKAADIALRLRDLIGTRKLPFATPVHGFSPMPKAYRVVAEGVSIAEFDSADTSIEAGLARWLDSLGAVRSARFFVLAGDVIRYEIAAGQTYRVGQWKQQWTDGRVTHFNLLKRP